VNPAPAGTRKPEPPFGARVRFIRHYRGRAPNGYSAHTRAADYLAVVYPDIPGLSFLAVRR
jgi:hypothetical protein